jgi:hypothetical protein
VPTTEEQNVPSIEQEQSVEADVTEEVEASRLTASSQDVLDEKDHIRYEKTDDQAEPVEAEVSYIHENHVEDERTTSIEDTVEDEKKTSMEDTVEDEKTEYEEDPIETRKSSIEEGHIEDETTYNKDVVRDDDTHNQDMSGSRTPEETAQEAMGDQEEEIIPRPPKLRGFQASRAATAPPLLTLATSKAEGIRSRDHSADRSQESFSPTESQDSFHSVETWTSVTSLPPSPPLSTHGSPTIIENPQDTIRPPKRRQANRDLSELVFTPTTPRVQKFSSGSNRSDESSSEYASIPDAEPSSRPSLENSTRCSSPAEYESVGSASATSDFSNTLRRRSYLRRRPGMGSMSLSPEPGALAPLPPAADLFTPRTYRTLRLVSSSTNSSSTSRSSSAHQNSRLQLIRRLPMAVILKTLEMLFSPPAHLIRLMLKVAAMILAGQWRGQVFGMGEGGEPIPVAWDWSDEDDDGEGELGGWGADEDFPGDVTRQMVGSYPESPCVNARARFFDPVVPEDQEDADSAAMLDHEALEDDTGDADWNRSWEVD